MIGAASSFGGRSSAGPATARRRNDGWIMEDASGITEAASLIELVATGKFVPRTVNVIPELAELLFKEAVGQAERSVLQVTKAAEHLEEMRAAGPIEDGVIGPWFMPWSLATGELDRALRASLAATMLAIAAAEAQVNVWIVEHGGWTADEDRLGVAEKCKALAERVDRPISLGKAPFQALHVAVKRRNAYVHPRPLEQPLPAVGRRAAVPGRTASQEARGTCKAVRDAFLDLARRLEVTPPKYLAYCPPCAADDDDGWRSASVMTGTRPDPDFPRAGEERTER